MITLKLKELNKEIRPIVKELLEIKNDHAIPRLLKISINMGVGASAVKDKKQADLAKEELRNIAGQEPVICYSTKSISNFGLREGMPIGVKVTLRGDKMWQFLERLIYIALPQINDFRGFNKKQFDGHGNFTFGLKEQTMFNEVNFNTNSQLRGMDITICTSATNDKAGEVFLTKLNLPFIS
ncbi:MAG: 50S ribosomal protein L5 [Alphaproteobacteria bacterium]|nr:50S ribosomal protein L5 [Alphaproteobacteria bacterium]MBL0718177.1 50S ribosomal protein L5 [Alphaproteobacteria bacterium]